MICGVPDYTETPTDEELLEQEESETHIKVRLD